jgi:hypothetical protein
VAALDGITNIASVAPFSGPGCVTTVGAAPLSALKLSTRVGPPARREPERLAVELGPSLQHEQFSFLGLDNHRLALIPRAARDDARQASGPVRRMVDCSKVPSNITLLCASTVGGVGSGIGVPLALSRSLIDSRAESGVGAASPDLVLVFFLRGPTSAGCELIPSSSTKVPGASGI